MKLKIKKGSVVKVISGAEKGKQGSVLDVNPKKMKILVQGIRVQTKHSKKDGLVKKEGYIDYSNVTLVEQAKAKAKTGKKKTAAKTA